MIANLHSVKWDLLEMKAAKTKRIWNNIVYYFLISMHIKELWKYFKSIAKFESIDVCSIEYTKVLDIDAQQ